MGRIAQTVGTGISAVGLLLGSAGAVHADERSYLDQLNETGAGNYYTSSANRLAIGRQICDNIRLDGDPRAGFNSWTNVTVPQQLIDIAQHELCADTLGGPK